MGKVPDLSVEALFDLYQLNAKEVMKELYPPTYFWRIMIFVCRLRWDELHIEIYNVLQMLLFKTHIIFCRCSYKALRAVPDYLLTKPISSLSFRKQVLNFLEAQIIFEDWAIQIIETSLPWDKVVGNCRDFPRPNDTLQWIVFLLETWLCRGSVVTGRIDFVCIT